MLITITLNPSVDQALFIEKLLVGDTNRIQKVEQDAGGKSTNVSRVYCELGLKSLATGFLGGATGQFVREVLTKQGVDHEFVEVKGATRTNFSVEDAAGSPPTTFNQKGPTISEENLEALLETCRTLAVKGEWLALGGSLPPGVPTNIYGTLIEIFKKHDCKVMLDADGEAAKGGLAAKPHFIKPNNKEAGRMLGREVKTLDQAAQAANDLLPFLAPHGIVILSRGADGAVLVNEGDTWYGESIPVEVKSTVGAGDSMIAGFMYGQAKGFSLDESLKWGLAAGSATAGSNGSQIGRRAKIEALLPLAKVTRL